MTNIGDVLNHPYLKTRVLENAAQRIGKHVGADIADLHISVDCRAANIHPDFAGMERFKDFFFLGKCIIEFHSCRYRNSRFTILNSALLEPLLDSENRDSDEGEEYHQAGVDPESMRIVSEWDLGAHREHVGIDSHGEEDSGENGEHFHRQFQLVGEEGIVGGFERLDGFFLALQDVPQADVGADHILEIDFCFRWDERVILLEDGFKDGALGFQGAAEVEDVALQDGDLENHLLFFFREDLIFDKIQLLADMVEAREAGIEKEGDDMVEEVGRSSFHGQSALAFALLQILEKFSELIDALAVAGDEMAVGQDDIQFARIRRPLLRVEEGDMDGKEQAVIVLHDFGLIGGRDELLYRQRMDIEIFLEKSDVIVLRVLKIDPRYFFVFEDFHFYLWPPPLCKGRVGRGLKFTLVYQAKV